MQSSNSERLIDKTSCGSVGGLKSSAADGSGSGSGKPTLSAQYSTVEMDHISALCSVMYIDNSSLL